jgi:hypothetical protein
MASSPNSCFSLGRSSYWYDYRCPATCLSARALYLPPACHRFRGYATQRSPLGARGEDSARPRGRDTVRQGPGVGLVATARGSMLSTAGVAQTQPGPVFAEVKCKSPLAKLISHLGGSTSMRSSKFLLPCPLLAGDRFATRLFVQPLGF